MTILAKHLTSFVFAAQDHLFHKQNIPCDAIMESSFPWQHHWIPPAWKILTCFFSFLIFLLNLCLPLNNSHCPITYALRKEQYHINRFLSIHKRTKSPFLETENYLLFKVPMPAHRFKSSD